MYRNILVPLDGSPLAEEILPHVKEIARLSGAAITLLSVVFAHTPASTFHVADTTDQQIAAKEAAEEYLKEVKQRLVDEDFLVATQVGYGNPVNEILVCAEREGISLLAMSTHGRTGWKRLAMGSVAEGVLRYSTKPVFIVRAQL